MSNKHTIQFIKLPFPDDSIVFFKTIKALSENYWQHTDINKSIYGFQIQSNSKWNPGLSEIQIEDFEGELNIKFPECLRNFYRTMNGLDCPGINVFGNSGTRPEYSPIYYSFPDDLNLIKEKINWILASNNLTKEKMIQEKIPEIFPVTGHRFLILNECNPILSMYGDDIVYWTESLSKLLATDLFENIDNDWEFENNPGNAKPVHFWLDSR